MTVLKLQNSFTLEKRTHLVGLYFPVKAQISIGAELILEIRRVTFFAIFSGHRID